MFIVRSQELMRTAPYLPYDDIINARMNRLGCGGIGESVVLRS
jgi:hypothetical protein